MPTPGSPPTSTSDAGTSPPPSTRSSSSSPVGIRSASSASTSTSRRSGRAGAAAAAPRTGTASSTIVPNAPQPGQRPSHRPGDGAALGAGVLEGRCLRHGGSHCTPGPRRQVCQICNTSSVPARSAPQGTIPPCATGLSATAGSRSRRSPSAPGSPSAPASATMRPRACVDAAFDVGHQLHRHRERLRPGRGRGVPRRGARRPAARLVRARDEGLLPDVEHRPGALAAADPQADRRVARPAAHRLRRPLPVPPLRRRDAARGDDGGADRDRPGRQGAPHRLLGVERRADPGRARPRPRRREVRLLPAAVLAPLAQPERGCSRSAPRTGSPRSSGRRSPRASSPASTCPARPPRKTPAWRATR